MTVDPAIADAIRFSFFAVAGVGVALMLTVNVLAFRVLRPGKRLGFLWWHITAISSSFLCLMAVALDRSLERLGQGLTWHTVVTGVGLVLFTSAQAIIYNVERRRYAEKRALEQRRADLARELEPGA